MRHRVLAFLVVLGLVLTLLVSAPRSSWANLSPSAMTLAQRRAVPTHYVYAHGSTRRPSSQLFAVQQDGVPTSYCGTYWYELTSYGGWGDPLWRLKVTVPWCWTYNTRIWAIGPPAVQASVLWYADLSGWDYNGVMSTSQYRLDPTPHMYRTYVQAKFSWCPPRLVCFGHMYPYVYLDVDTLGDGFLHAKGGTSWL